MVLCSHPEALQAKSHITSLMTVEPMSHLGFSCKDDFSRNKNRTGDLTFDIVVLLTGQDAFSLEPKIPSSSLQWSKLAFSW